MASFLQVIANHRLANDLENPALHDYLQFHLDELMDVFAELNSDIDVEVQ